MRKTSGSSRAFDLSAEIYDADAASNPMMAWLRRESLRELARAFHAGDTLLEIGCGTGEEAVALARRDISVVATDASPGMIAVVDAKIEREPQLRSSITTKMLPAEDLDALIEEYGPSSFDGAYSSLGPLNCTPNLVGVTSSLALLTRPGGRLEVSLLNKYCLWETLWYLSALNPRSSFRRWGGHARGTALPGGPTLDVYYWPIRQFERIFTQAGFEVVSKRALPWALPPTYAAHILKGKPRLRKALNRIERRTDHRWPFYALGDHIHFSMVRQ